MKVSKEQIEDFLKGKRIAVAGVSRNPKKFGYQTFKSLSELGYNIVPVNPNTDKIDQTKCYRNITDLPSDIESILIMTGKENSNQILRESIQKGIKNIWVQQMSDTRETLKIAEEYQKEIIFKKCIFMFTEPVSGMHKFHRNLKRLFNLLPK
jgi:predicted CoA-binding protein